MKIFRTEQIKEIDDFTIRSEPVRSVDLMERAASGLFRWFIRTFDRSRRVLVFTGPGNNGGDGLALARMLSDSRFVVEIFHVKFTERVSPDWEINRARIENETPVIVNFIETREQFPLVDREDIVIDAIFGTGLTRPAEGLAAEIIKYLNRAGSTIVSVDMPSGLFGEDNSKNIHENIIRADFTLSFQFPRLSFLFPENARYTGEWSVIPIGLSNTAIRNVQTPFCYVENTDILPLLRKRSRFDHKGMYGHGLLIAGSRGKMGAAVLGAKAALKTGIGLLTCQVPSDGNGILQTAIPEAMLRLDENDRIVTDVSDIESFDAIGAGPGLGADPLTQKAFQSVLLNRSIPMVIDADGINILGQNRKWLSALPQKTILTPHIREFERIADKTESSFERLERQIWFATKWNTVIVLKGAFTSIATPDGKVWFNSTGNPGMATAGSGDALTGMILSLLAQGYTPENAAVAGVYLHGLAGDIAAARYGTESVTASDIIENIGNAFIKVRSDEFNKSD